MLFYKLSNKEKQIMIIFWNSHTSLTASDICKIDSSLNSNTVQASLKKLLKYKFIKVADIVYSGTVLARTYETVITMDKYASMQLQDYYQSCHNKGSISNLVSYFLDDDKQREETLNELEKLINEKKKNL
jgi:Predicted transcriptional regulator